MSTCPSTRKPASVSSASRPAYGMWADRDDIGDGVEYVNRLRKYRREPQPEAEQRIGKISAVCDVDGGTGSAWVLDDTHRFSVRPERGLRRFGGKWAGNSRPINTIGPELGLRRLQQSLAHNSNKICALDPELGLRDVPGKPAQRRGEFQRFRTVPPRPLLDPTGDEVVGMPLPPFLLLLPAPRALAIRLAAGPLAGTDAGIGTKPAAADRTGSLAGVRHGDPMITPPSRSPIRSIGRVGPFWQAGVGQFSRAPKIQLRRQPEGLDRIPRDQRMIDGSFIGAASQAVTRRRVGLRIKVGGSEE